jgi:hypothetical protein
MLAFVTDSGEEGRIHFHYDQPLRRNPTVTFRGLTMQVQNAVVEINDPTVPLGHVRSDIALHDAALEDCLRVAHTDPALAVCFGAGFLAIKYGPVPSVRLLEHDNVIALVLIFDNGVPHPVGGARGIFSTQEMCLARLQGE